MLYTLIKRRFSISFLVMMGLVFFMMSGEITSAQVFEFIPNSNSPKPAPLPIVQGNKPSIQQGGNGNTPPRTPGQQQHPTNPGFPWLPVTVPGGPAGTGNLSAGAAGITIDYSCPLFDQEGNSDLMVSLDALSKALPMKAACSQNDTNLNELYQKQKDMFKAVSDIKSFITSSNNLWTEEKGSEEQITQINEFSNQISSLMSNIGYLSEALGNNKLLDSNCKSEMIYKGKALHALSDLILQISPYAVLAAKAGGDMTVLGPVITGFTGIASLVKTVSKLNKNDEIDMSQSENRMLVMKATCEYIRIEGKLRILLQSELGTRQSQNEGVKKLNQLIYSKENALKDLEKALINKEENSLLANTLEERTEFYNKTKVIREKIRLDWSEYLKYDEVRNSDKSDNNLCTLGGFIVEEKNANKFPYTMDMTVGFLESLSNFNKGTLDYKIAKTNFKKSLDRLENKILSNNPPPANIPGAPTCGSFAQETLNSTAKFLQVIEEQVIATEKSYEEDLQKNESYKEWYQKNRSLIKDRDNLKGIVKVITRASEPLSSKNLSDLSIRLNQLRLTLFGTKDSFPKIKHIMKSVGLDKIMGIDLNIESQSPLGSWFKYTAIQHAEAASSFEEAVQSLLNETKEELKNYIKQAEENARKGSSTPWRDSFDSSKKTKDYFQYITLKTFPKDKSIHKVMCAKLRQVAFNWKSANAHLVEMKNVCSTLRDYIDINTGEGVVEFCGMMTINRNANTPTFINSVENDLEKRGLPLKAYKVNQKYSELECF